MWKTYAVIELASKNKTTLKKCQQSKDLKIDDKLWQTILEGEGK